MLSRYGCFLYGMDGDECPLQVHAMVLGSYFFSAHSFARGGDEIVDAFARRLAEHGVDIHLGCRAAKLELDHNRRVHGVHLESGDMIECEDCICTFHPQLLPDILPPDSMRRSFLTRLSSLENTSGLFAVFLAVDNPPDDLLWSNAYILGADSKRCGYSSDLAVMACGQSSVDVGRKSLCVMRANPIAPERIGEDKCNDRVTKWSRTDAYERLKEEEVKRTLEMLHDSFPELRGRYHVLDAATPCTYESYTGTVGGAAYGLKRSTGLTTLSARTPLHGLYLAGQSVIAPGLLGVLTSSLLAVAGILGFETVWNELRRCR
jgi:all-trans-retinol 13,14-reductase